MNSWRKTFAYVLTHIYINQCQTFNKRKAGPGFRTWKFSAKQASTSERSTRGSCTQETEEGLTLSLKDFKHQKLCQTRATAHDYIGITFTCKRVPPSSHLCTHPLPPTGCFLTRLAWWDHFDTHTHAHAQTHKHTHTHALTPTHKERERNERTVLLFMSCAHIKREWFNTFCRGIQTRIPT